MESLFAQLVEENTPKMNSDIVNGLAVKMMPFAEQYVDEVMRTVSRSFPPGLVYLGCERCTPTEEFRNSTRAYGSDDGRSSGKKRVVDIVRSDIYSMKYLFQYDYQEMEGGRLVNKSDIITRYLYLPFVGEAGGTTIGGNKFFIHPVLTDKVISPSNETIFVRLMRDKIIFKRLYYTIFVDNTKTTMNVVWASLYRNASNGRVIDKVTKAVSTAAHYLLGKYGFSEFFQKYFGFVPEIGYLNGKMIPADPEYVVFRSTGLKPKGNIERNYIPTDIFFRIPASRHNQYIRDMIAGIFYVIDHFPESARIEYFDDPRMWRAMLGSIIFSNSYSTGKILENVKEHYNSLDQYVDTIIVKKLIESGYPCSDFYDLLALTIKEFSYWLIASNQNVNTMYGKELSILYPVFYPITKELFSLVFKLNKAFLKKPLSLKEIIEIMNRSLKPGLIFKLRRAEAPKSNISYCGDNKFFRITCIIIPQENNVTGGDGKKKKKRISENDPINKLHASIAEGGGYLNITKPNPVGTGRINPYVFLDASSTIVPNPETKLFIEHVQNLLTGKE
jgi:hypothetical protein